MILDCFAGLSSSRGVEAYAGVEKPTALDPTALDPTHPISGVVSKISKAGPERVVVALSHDWPKRRNPWFVI